MKDELEDAVKGGELSSRNDRLKESVGGAGKEEGKEKQKRGKRKGEGKGEGERGRRKDTQLPCTSWQKLRFALG